MGTANRQSFFHICPHETAAIYTGVEITIVSYAFFPARGQFATKFYYIQLQFEFSPEFYLCGKDMLPLEAYQDCT